MEFRQLQYFLKAAREGSFSKAAEKAYISQQALSKAIASLEKELNLSLFRRTARGAVLTEEGKIFQERARAILELVDSTVREMQSIHAGKNQNLFLFITSGLEDLLDTDCLLAFAQRYPAYTVCTRANDDIQIEKKIMDGSEEIGIVGSMGNQDQFDAVRLLDPDTLVAVSREHPLSGRSSVPFRALAGEKFIFTHAHHYANTRLSHCCREAGFTPNVYYETAEISYTAKLVAANQGIFLLPSLPLSTSAFSEDKVSFLKQKERRTVLSVLRPLFLYENPLGLEIYFPQEDVRFCRGGGKHDLVKAAERIGRIIRMAHMGFKICFRLPAFCGCEAVWTALGNIYIIIYISLLFPRGGTQNLRCFQNFLQFPFF